MWKLVIEDDEGKRTTVPLTRDEYTLGRQEGNTIRLTERNVSRDHGRIRRKPSNGSGGPDTFVLEDRSSYNGVFVNGLRVAHTKDLVHGDLVQIGDYRIVLQDDNAASDSNATIPITQTDPGADVRSTVPLARGQRLTERPRRFVMLVGPTPGIEYPLDRDRLTIGRAEDATISINHNSVSRLHCEVHALGDGRFEIVDKGSSNGVRVNAVELKRSIIEAGDVIELGDVRFKFVGAGQVFVPGPNESQQLTAISDRDAELADPRRKSWGGYALPVLGAGVVGAVVILAFVYILRARAAGQLPTHGEITPPADGEQALVMHAIATCTVDECEAAFAQISTLPEHSAWRNSAEFHRIELLWADSLLKKAAHEQDSGQKRLLLARVASLKTLDEARKKQISLELASLEPAPTATPSQLPSPAEPDTPPSTTTTTSSSARVAPSTRPPPPPKTVSPPPPAPPATPTVKPNTPSVMERARQAGLDGRDQEVRNLLEGRVRSGKAGPEEVRLVREACKKMHDTACTEDIRQKYPSP